uniref:DUF2236 domain-containing protein n=1 Tax=Haemonchus contortus TaxID=6289 RepID=A0A7I4YWQ9_HAECO
MKKIIQQTVDPCMYVADHKPSRLRPFLLHTFMTERWNNLGNNVDSPQRATYESFWKKSYPSTSIVQPMEWNGIALRTPITGEIRPIVCLGLDRF